MNPDIRITMIRLSQKIAKNPDYADKIGVKVEYIRSKENSIVSDKHF